MSSRSMAFDGGCRRRAAGRAAVRGSDFQNLHRNKARDDAESQKSPRALDVFPPASLRRPMSSSRIFRPDREGKTRHRLRKRAQRSIRASSIWQHFPASDRMAPTTSGRASIRSPKEWGGLMSITGARRGEGPMRVGIPVADLSAGPVLRHGHSHRTSGARGFPAKASGSRPRCCRRRSSCWISRPPAWADGKRKVAKQAGNNHPTSIPTGVFKTSDGYINIATTGGRIWERFCAGDRRT